MGHAPLDTAAARRLAASSPFYNAMMRTTCVATILQGGHAVNALPQRATANVNCRMLPEYTPEEVLATLPSAPFLQTVPTLFLYTRRPRSAPFCPFLWWHVS
jgi:hypothetical protein